MIALLRYMTLKSIRDRSLFGLVLAPMLWPVVALVGVAISERRLHYPFTLNASLSAVGNATLLAQITSASVLIFAAVTSFWILRPETAAKALGSFVFAVRPVTIVLALTIFATALGLTSWAGAVAILRILTAAVPPSLGAVALHVVVMTLAMSTVGILMVMISSQPAMVVGAYAFAILLIPLEKRPASWQTIAGIAIAIVAAGVSTFLMERRCAT